METESDEIHRICLILPPEPRIYADERESDIIFERSETIK